MQSRNIWKGFSAGHGPFSPPLWSSMRVLCAFQALLVASAHDASAVGEEEDAAEEEAKARAARSKLGQLCGRCRTHSAALRLQCAEATLACAGAALAGDDCVEEIRRAPALSICALRLFV